VRTSEVKVPAKAALATNLLDQARQGDDPMIWGEMAAGLARDTAMFRTSGCVTLDIARVSAGLLDAAVIFRPQAADFDLGVTLAMESGALTGDFSGNPAVGAARQLVVANPKLFRELLKTLHPFRGRLPR
jgi:myo-inositol-1(or 4)-monophosphatase